MIKWRIPLLSQNRLTNQRSIITIWIMLDRKKQQPNDKQRRIRIEVTMTAIVIMKHNSVGLIHIVTPAIIMMITTMVGIGILASVSAILSGDGEFPMDILITVIIILIITMGTIILIGIIHTPITMVGMTHIHTMDIMDIMDTMVVAITAGITMVTIMAITVIGIRITDVEAQGIQIPIIIPADQPITL